MDRLELFRSYCGTNNFYLSPVFYEWLVNHQFFEAPASAKYHGACEGGLFDHSVEVYAMLENITDNMHLNWMRPQSPFIVGMFHDLCKCDSYCKVLTPDPLDEVTGNHHPAIVHYEYNNDVLLKGHGDKSIMLLSQFITLTEEEILCIRYHMGAYEKDDWPEFDKAIRKYPNVLWTHTADMYVSKVENL